MKKSVFISFLAVAAFMLPAIQSSAQVSLLSATGYTLDTVTNTSVKIMAKQVKGYQETVTVQVNLIKISGTMGGTMVPVASNDGVKYYDISQKSSDTVTVANVATAGKNYSLVRGYLYYGVQWTGTGTMSASIGGTLVARKATQ